MTTNKRGRKISQWVGSALANYLTKEVREYKKFSAHRLETLEAAMQPGDVLLVEGDTRISSIIKYLTQSTWSHAAFYVGVNRLPSGTAVNTDGVTTQVTEKTPMLIEADLKDGVIALPLERYNGFNIRICRPLALHPDDTQKICDFMINSLGMNYDLKNVADLARYLLPRPPVPRRWRRRMLALGSSDPTRAICSTLIARAFQSIKYPILPDVFDCGSDGIRAEILHIRHHSLFAPRDFDVSPFFQIVKPELASGFDYKTINWTSHSKDFLTTGETEFDCRLCKDYEQRSEQPASPKCG